MSLSLSDRSYIAIDWNQKAKDLFFDEKAAEVRILNHKWGLKICFSKKLHLDLILRNLS